MAVSKLKRFLRWRYESPAGMRYAAQIAAMIVTWVVLGIAGLGFTATLFGGLAAGLLAEAATHLWWRRRERRRDLANGYVSPPRDEA
ncbi:MAG: hypothetical protein V7607_1131 [Solirubrobacteraceae bacterium]